jgi:hypothetical protein
MVSLNQLFPAIFVGTLLLGVSGCDGQAQKPEQIQVAKLINQYKPGIKTSILVEIPIGNLRDLPQQRCNKDKVFKVGGEWSNINLIKAKFPAKCWSYRGEMSGIYVISFPSKNK